MPTYEYMCKGCGHEFELFQRMSDPVRKKCPKCSALSLYRRPGTGAAVLFKGSGFYETDYRSESYKKAAAADAPSDGKTGEKKDAKQDTKKDATKDAKKESGGASDAGAKSAPKDAKKKSPRKSEAE